MYARLGKEAQAGVEAWLREGERLRREEEERIGAGEGDAERGAEVERSPEWSNEPLAVGEDEASDSARPRVSEEEPPHTQQPRPEEEPQLYPQHHNRQHARQHQHRRQEPYRRHDDHHHRQRQHIRQHRQHHGHHDQHHHPQSIDAPQIPHAPPAAHPPTDDTLSPGRTVDRLVRKLSQQHLHRRRSSLAQQLAPPAQEPAELRRFRYWAEHEIHRQADHHHHPLLLPDPAAEDDASPDGEQAVPWLPMPTLAAGEPIEIDEEYGSAAQQQQDEDDEALLLAALRRPRRKQSTALRSTASTPRLPAVNHPRVEEMIAAGSQCTVLPPAIPPPSPSPPLPQPTFSSSLPPVSSSSLSTIPRSEPPFIEPDPTCSLPILSDTEDDPATTTSSFPLTATTTTTSTTLRAAAGPGGVRKYTVGGISLRYRLSADAALRCANVVRSRPRMRRRTKSRFGTGTGGGSSVGGGSLATGSGGTSPVMSVAGSVGGLLPL